MRYYTIRNFSEKFSDFWEGDYKAEVWKDNEGNWWTRHYKNRVWQFDIVHEGRNQTWAENAAENYVLGVMNWS